MILPDVNVLVYAHRSDTPAHAVVRAWLEAEINSERSFGLSPLVASGFIRVVTNHRVFQSPSTLEEALGFVEQLRARPNAVLLEPGPRHWEIFAGLCRAAAARGNLVADAYLAALAIETGSDWITTDRDFSRFHGLVWRQPG